MARERPDHTGGPRRLDRPAVHLVENPIVIADGNTIVADAWTTVFTAEHGTLVTWASFVSTDSTVYAVKARLLKPNGDTRRIMAATFDDEDDQWRPMDQQQAIYIPPRWGLQLFGSGGSPVNVDHYICGVERWLPRP